MYINSAGMKLDVTKANIENDINQQFVFGQGDWSTVIDSVAQQGIVWDVADNERFIPPPGTPLYLFTFHGRHNQHFICINEKIYAKQNGMVVTYIGGQTPFQMMPPTSDLQSRQTLHLQLLQC